MRKVFSTNIATRLTRSGIAIGLASMFLLAALLRLVNLANPPLDFFPQRQLRGAIIARAIYQQLIPSADPSTREQAVFLMHNMDVREPSIFEGLVAATYLVTGEQLWVARLYAILFWLLGGIALYALARRLTSPVAALAPVIYYFFLPWSVIFSRIFQPDILMVMLVLWAAYTLYRWGEAPTSWKWALASGLLAGIATLVKLPAIFPLALIIAGIALTHLGLKQALASRQLWLIVVLLLVFPIVYYLFVIPGISRGWLGFTLELVDSWLSPSFYLRWIIFAGGLVDLGVAFISFIGVWLLPKRERVIPLALWLGYILYGLAFPYHILTHEYYSIPLIPAIALSVAPLAQLVYTHVRQSSRITRIALTAVVVFSIAYSSWMARSMLLSSDYRSEPASWTRVGKALPPSGDLIGVSHEQGYRLAYYAWRMVTPWIYDAAYEQSLASEPNPQEAFRQAFEAATAGRDYFVVTLFSQFDALPMLKSYLYGNYPVYAQGEGYLIFDLTSPTAP